MQPVSLNIIHNLVEMHQLTRRSEIEQLKETPDSLRDCRRMYGLSWLYELRWLWTIRPTGLFSCPLCLFPLSFLSPYLLLFLFVLFQSCRSHTQVFGRTLVREFHIFYSHTEWNFIFFRSHWINIVLVGECY